MRLAISRRGAVGKGEDQHLTPVRNPFPHGLLVEVDKGVCLPGARSQRARGAGRRCRECQWQVFPLVRGGRIDYAAGPGFQVRVPC